MLNELYSELIFQENGIHRKYEINACLTRIGPLIVTDPSLLICNHLMIAASIFEKCIGASLLTFTQPELTALNMSTLFRIQSPSKPLEIPYLAATLAFFAPLSTSVIAACLTAMVWLDRFLVVVGAIVTCLCTWTSVYEGAEERCAVCMWIGVIDLK